MNPFDLEAEAERFADRQRRYEQLARQRHNVPFNEARNKRRDLERQGHAKNLYGDSTPSNLSRWTHQDPAKAIDDADARKVQKLSRPVSLVTVCAMLDALTDASGFGSPHLKAWSLVQHLHGRGWVRAEDMLPYLVQSRSKGSRDEVWLKGMLRCLRRCGAIVMNHGMGYTLSFRTSRGDEIDLDPALGTWIEWASRNGAKWPKDGYNLGRALKLAIDRGWYKGTLQDALLLVSKAKRST